LLSELEPGLDGLHSLTSSEFADWTPCTVATKADVENHFNTHGTGEITEIKLMNGFGFIEYKDAMDARDVVPGMLPNHLAAALQQLCSSSSCNRYANPSSSFP